MNQSNANFDTMEIDFKDLFHQFLMQWRMILAVSLALALLMSGAMYIRGEESQEVIPSEELQSGETDAISNQSQTFSASEVSAAKARLTEAERTAVEGAITNIANALELEDYMNQSLLMQIDPMNERVLTIQYYITGISPEKASTLSSAYVAELSAGDYTRNIADAIGCPQDTDEKYINELYSVGISGGGVTASNHVISPVLSVQIILPSGGEGSADFDQDSCTMAIDQAINSLCTNLSALIEPHQVVRLSAQVSTKVDLDLRTKIVNNNTAISSTKSQTAAAVASYTEDQKLVYDAGMKPIRDKYGLKANTETTTKPSSDEVEEEPVEPVTRTVVTHTFSVKYFSIGFVVGIFLYFTFYLLLVVLRHKVNTLSELEAYIGRPGYGESHSYRGRVKNALGRFVWDQRLYNRYYKGRLATEEAAVNNTLSRLVTDISIQTTPPEKVSVVSLEELTESVAVFAKALTDRLSEQGTVPVVNTISASPDELSRDAEKVAGLGTVVLLAQGGVTKQSDVVGFLDLVKRYNISVLGCVLAE